jgi:hypothetical protein
MVNREQCIPGLKVIVNDKIIKWNTSMGTEKNGLMCFQPHSSGGHMIGDPEFEILPGTELELLSKVKRFGVGGIQVRFKIIGSDQILSAWWICFKHKINIT